MSTRSLSDYNDSNGSILVSRSRLFSDLNLGMPIHPNKKDITPYYDLDAIKQSVKNIVLTNKGEKLFKPEVGGNITSYLFENVDVFTAVSIRTDIERALSLHEPRISDITVQVTDNMDKNEYYITIGFKIINNPQPLQVEFELTRLR